MYVEVYLIHGKKFVEFFVIISRTRCILNSESMQLILKSCIEWRFAIISEIGNMHLVPSNVWEFPDLNLTSCLEP